MLPRRFLTRMKFVKKGAPCVAHQRLPTRQQCVPAGLHSLEGALCLRLFASRVDAPPLFSPSCSGARPPRSTPPFVVVTHLNQSVCPLGDSGNQPLRPTCISKYSASPLARVHAIHWPPAHNCLPPKPALAVACQLAPPFLLLMMPARLACLWCPDPWGRRAPTMIGPIRMSPASAKSCIF